MTISVVSFQQAVTPSAGSGVQITATGLLTTDLLVAIFAKDTTSGTPGLNGGSATFTNLNSNTSGRDYYVWTAPGPAGGSTTVTFTPTIGNADAALYVLRSSLGVLPSVFFSDIAVVSAAASVSNAFSIQAPGGSWLLATINGSNASAGTLSGSPSSGWTQDGSQGALANLKLYSQNVVSPTTLELTATASGSINLIVLHRMIVTDLEHVFLRSLLAEVVAGYAEPPAPPFYGWGLPLT